MSLDKKMEFLLTYQNYFVVNLVVRMIYSFLVGFLILHFALNLYI